MGWLGREEVKEAVSKVVPRTALATLIIALELHITDLLVCTRRRLKEAN